MMRKKVAKRNLIFYSVLIIIGLIFTFISFNIPTTTDKFVGFGKALPLDMNLGGGYTGVYTVGQYSDNEINFDNNYKNTIKELEDFLSQSFYDYSVVVLDNNTLRIELPNFSSAQSILQTITNTGAIEFKSEDSETAQSKMSTEYVKSAEYQLNNGAHGVMLTFTSEGGDKFYNLTSELLNSNIYMYVGGKSFFSSSVNQAMSGGKIFIQANGEVEARVAAFKLSASIKDVKIVNDKVVEFSPILGNNSDVVVGLMFLFVIISAMALFIKKYKKLGLMAVMVLSIWVVVMSLILSLLSTTLLTFTLLAGILLSFIATSFTLSYTLDKIITEFESGKKAHVSLKYAYKKGLINSILDINLPLIIVAIICNWVPSIFAKTIALPIILGQSFSIVLALFVLRHFIYNLINTVGGRLNKLGIEKAVVENEEE